MADQRSLLKENLANVRHDLKTPIGHILGYSEMLAEDLEENAWPEFQQDLEKVHSSGSKLLTLIEDFLGPNKQSIDDIDFNSAEYQLRMQLNHISGYCEMLIELAEEEQKNELIPDLNHIAQAAQNFTDLVTENVTLSAFQALLGQSNQPENKLSPIEKESIAQVQQTKQVHFNLLGEGGLILVVDDNPDNCELLTRRLNRNGYQSQAVESGKEALDLLKQQNFDLILLDMIMPEMSGLDVLKVLKQDSVLRNIPVIILSALDDIDQVVNCILLGADDYVFKPFNPILLKARIAASLEKFRLRKNQVPRLRVFISSPGDVIAERQIARRIINDINDELVDKVHLVPIFWEDEPLLVHDTFQAQIAPAKDCEIYIGIFWSRLGSKLPDTIIREDGSCYLSGSEYEFEDALSGFKKTGFPQLLVYRKMSEINIPLIDRTQVMDRLEQKEKVENFMEQWFMTEDKQSFTGAFHGFSSSEDFTLMLTKHLKKLVLNQLENKTDITLVK